jgi:excinuclease ABC subunit A
MSWCRQTKPANRAAALPTDPQVRKRGVSSEPCIRITGVRQNNLAGFDVDLPLGELIVVTGPSGSGKSSFAFDTVYAEGQRRYVETFSPYTRQFLDRMDKPQVEAIEGIPPSIAIEQSNHVKSTRSTVGTITEINDYLKLLFPRVARGMCPDCAREVVPESAQRIGERLAAEFRGRQILLTFPVAAGQQGADAVRDFFAFLQGQGYLRIWLYGAVVRTDEAEVPEVLPAVVQVVQDRLLPKGRVAARLVEAVETALRLGQGKLQAVVEESGEVFPFSTGWHCAHCDRDLRTPTPGLFSFNNPLGACTTCRGFGRTIGIDYERALPDRSLSIAEGVVRPFQSGFSTECQQDLLRHCGERGIDIDVPFCDLPAGDQQFVIEGEIGSGQTADEVWESGGWYGVKGYFAWMESRTYKMHVRVLLSRYRSYRLCPDCGGGRFQPEALQFLFPGPGDQMLTLPALAGLPVRDLPEMFTALELPAQDNSSRLLRDQIVARLRYLQEVGLGYLTLDRPSRSLSGGEMERVNLTSCLGASLVNTLFVMDEPSVGLHPRDLGQLIAVMEQLRDKGNTLLVVEHEEAVIRRADHLIDIGPGRGREGGQLVFAGSAAGIRDCENSLTADYLTGRQRIEVPAARREPRDWIRLRGVRHHNLNRLDVDIPLGVFCCVTGVSGSGKSSLVHDVLYRNLDLDPTAEAEAPGFCRDVDCPLDIEEVVMVDQSPLAKTPRSTPAVYLGVFDAVREMFGLSEEAVSSGFTPSSFSFNSGTGRCERCQGLGFEKIEMQFLSDLFLRCPECGGSRYGDKVLQVRIGGRNIADVLEMTAAEALVFFADKEKKEEITGPLRLLAEVGLDYLRLGQPVNTLSGGESQRLKLIKRLLGQKGGGEQTLLIFDEPTTGLHFDDVRLLLKVFQRLVDEGHSLVVVEHNLEVIKSADFLLDLGPDAGDRGGQLVVAGTPEEVAQCEASHTGRFLAPLLPGGSARVQEYALPVPRVKVPGSTAVAVRGAREHNLKNIHLQIPRDELVVVTGLSGSGKSTLAFDLLFAEGQRRFLDSMSPYARQFVEQMEKPEVDSIEGLPPTVAIEQRVTRGGGKSTVATVTEIYHFLRLLFAKLGTQYCPDCQVAVEKNTVAAAVERALVPLKKGRLQIFAPLVRGRKGFHTEVARWAARQGFEFLLVDGALQRVQGFQKLERFKEHHIDVLVGEVEKNDNQGLEPVLRRALELGKGTARLLDARGHFHLLSTEMNCPGCGRSFDELDPRLFSYHSPHGWCTHCRGFGEVWKEVTHAEFETEVEAELAEERRFERLEEGEAYRCPVCVGSRLNETAGAVRLANTSLPDVARGSAVQVLAWVEKLRFKGVEAEIARDLLPEIAQRLRFLLEVGLDYLNLDRAAKTLSGGESQRIRLAAQLGSNLRGVLYVLDEPTIGLHQQDNEQLLNSLQTLVEKGNSLLVVEHDEDTMRRAAHIVDLGPGAGALGGEVVAQGTMEEIMAVPGSVTGRYLREPMRHPLRGQRRSLQDVEWLELTGATKNNLQDLSVSLPIGRLSVITGVSGSGKSTLVRGVLVPAVREKLARGRRTVKGTRSWTDCTGVEQLGALTEMDQSPIGKTSRSTPGTYVKVFDEIRKLFANLPEARLRGYTASRFSFNTEGGRCEACQGQGVIKLEMSFLPTTYMPCEDCHGARFNPATLEVQYQGKSIGDVMNMTIAEAAEFFAAVPKIHRSLQLLADTGLGYLRLGQPSPTLSGGEAQRIKLVAELAQRAGVKETMLRTGRRGKSTLYVLEEPTIGLHAADVERLLDVLHRLVDEGGTVVVIEHHLDLIAEADWVVDLGPGAGERGGKIVVKGTPEQVAKSKRSATGTFLAPLLKG